MKAIASHYRHAIYSKYSTHYFYNIALYPLHFSNHAGNASALESLAKARHPAAKAAAKAASQAPAKQGASKKRSCGAGRPACARTIGGENASLREVRIHSRIVTKWP